MANFCSKGVKRSVINGATAFITSKNIMFPENNSPLKIRLLQCYQVLWIHDIDEICKIFQIRKLQLDFIDVDSSTEICSVFIYDY